MLAEILAQTAAGNAVSVVLYHAEFTTHRRVLFKDLLDHRRRTRIARAAAGDELAAQAQDLKLGY